MPCVCVAVAHELGQEEALRRVKQKSDLVRDAYQAEVSGAEDRWEGNTLWFSFSAMGLAIKGSFTVEPSQVKMAAEVPFAVMIFKGAIEQRVRRELSELLA